MTAFSDDRKPIDLGLDRAHTARVYDVFLGGKTNYAPDREAAERVLEEMPFVRKAARECRAFMHRVARYLAAEAGIRQFLDIGTGIPTPPNLHEVVQEIAPESRVVYADNDPIVLAHSRALHDSHPAGRTAYVHGDLGDPRSILDSPEILETLDLSQPVALTLLAVLHWLPAEIDPYAVVRELLDALPSGSYLALSYSTADFDRTRLSAVVTRFREHGTNVILREKSEIQQFFTGLDLIEPGLQPVGLWRPGLHAVDPSAEPGNLTPMYAGVARKP